MSMPVQHSSENALVFGNATIRTVIKFELLVKIQEIVHAAQLLVHRVRLRQTQHLPRQATCNQIVVRKLVCSDCQANEQQTVVRMSLVVYSLQLPSNCTDSRITCFGVSSSSTTAAGVGFSCFLPSNSIEFSLSLPSL